MRTDVRTNGMERFWSMQKLAHKGAFHKHLNRYVRKFACKHNIKAVRQCSPASEARVGGR